MLKYGILAIIQTCGAWQILQENILKWQKALYVKNMWLNYVWRGAEK